MKVNNFTKGKTMSVEVHSYQTLIFFNFQITF